MLYIAYQQWRMSKNKWRFDRYEKRLKDDDKQRKPILYLDRKYLSTSKRFSEEGQSFITRTSNIAIAHKPRHRATITRQL
jgi:hypothetical protein